MDRFPTKPLARRRTAARSLAIRLHRAGTLVLHASAVSSKGKGIAFLGGPRWGKSSLAAAMVGSGGTFLADDILPVEMTGGRALVHVTGSHLKMWDQAARKILGVNPTRHPKVHPDLSKRFYDMEMQQVRSPVRLERVYVIKRGRMFSIEHLSRNQGILELLRHTFVARGIRKKDAPTHFAQCGDVASSVSLFRLTVPRSLDNLPRVVRAIENHLIPKKRSD